MSRIVQKEKERQKLFLNSRFTPSITIACHKHSLINLKEYIEEIAEQLDDYLEGETETDGISIRRDQLKDDIKELNKMIEGYE